MYNQNGLTVELITENGNKITEFNHNGLTYIEGRKGSEYKIKVTNHTTNRIKTIISVDGLDILTGKRAQSNGGGYVINAYGTEILDGWRVSNEQVRKFFFTKQANTYNAKTGNDTDNLGVIGVIAYKEYKPIVAHSYNMLLSGHYAMPTTMRGFARGKIVNCSNTMGGNAATAEYVMPTSALNNDSYTSSDSLATESVGTGMGKHKESKVETIHAIWESTPFATTLLYYKTRKELEAMGIVVATIKSKPLPSAFGGYCKEV